jgi:hypothetical protein
MLHLKNDRGYHKKSSPVPTQITLLYPPFVSQTPLQYPNNPNDSPSNNNTHLNCSSPRCSSPTTPCRRRRLRSSHLQPKRRRNHCTPIHRGSPHTRRRGLGRTSSPRSPRRRSTPGPGGPARPVGWRTRRCAPPCGPGGGAPVAAGGPGGPRTVVGGAEGAGTVGTCWALG